MTIAEITAYLESKTPLPGLTDKQNATVQELYELGHVRDAQNTALNILQPKIDGRRAKTMQTRKIKQNSLQPYSFVIGYSI